LLGPGHAGVEEETGEKKKIEEKTPGEPDAKKGDGKKSGTRENYNEHIESMKKKSQQDADNAIKNAKDSVNQNEKEAFLRGREIGREKVERLRSLTEESATKPGGTPRPGNAMPMPARRYSRTSTLCTS